VRQEGLSQLKVFLTLSGIRLIVQTRIMNNLINRCLRIFTEVQYLYLEGIGVCWRRVLSCDLKKRSMDLMQLKASR